MKIIVRILVFTILVFLNNKITANTSIDKVIAAIDNKPIMLSEYRAYYEQERFSNSQLPPLDNNITALNQQILERIIDERIQEYQAELRGIRVSEQEVDRAVSIIANQNNITQQALISQLERDGFTYVQFRENLKRQQLVRKLIDMVANSRVVVNDQEVENYVATHDELQANDKAYEVAQLFVSTNTKSSTEISREKENMEFILNSLNDSLSFESAVESYSEDSAKQDSGYLGWRTAKELPDLFVNTLDNLKIGGTSKVLQSTNGFHILKLLNIKDDSKKVQQQLIQHILIQPDINNNTEEAEKLAYEIFEKINQGESFDKLARLYSADPRTKEEGGSLGWVNPGSTLPAFEEVASNLPLNTISKPVKTNFGFHIIQVLDRREVSMSEEIALNKAREIIFQRKANDLYQRWFRTIRKQSFVEYIEEYL